MMTSTESWSERTTQSTEPGTVTAGVGAISPSRLCFADAFIVEHSDLFREAIIARNVYAAWARKLTNAKPNDPDQQTIHMDVSKSEGTRQNNSSFEEPNCRFPEEARVEKAGSGSSSPLYLSPQGQKGGEEIRRLHSPKQLVRKAHSPRSSPPPSPTSPSAPAIDGALLEVPGEEEMETSAETSQVQEEVPVVAKKPRILPFFVSPKGDWRQLVALAKLIAPTPFQSQMSGRFLKVTVADDVDYRALSQWLETSGVEFKSFMLKQDRPVKVVLRGLPSNTEPEDIKTEIEAEGTYGRHLIEQRHLCPCSTFKFKTARMRLRYMILPNFSARASKLSPSAAAIKSISSGDVRGGFTPRRCATSLHAVFVVQGPTRPRTAHLISMRR
ncbi:zinc finger protein [Trichonephila clavipes]|nr:zinc finger protein [Trichonephila clavipes]